MGGVRLLLVACVVAAVVGCGSGSRVSSSDDRAMSSPAWSPDGRLIAWDEHSTTSSSESVVWVADADGSDPHAVTDSIDALGQLQWLSSRELAYWSNYRVYRLRLGGKPTPLASVTAPTFSVDRAGTRLASGASVCPQCIGPIKVVPLRAGVPAAELGSREAQNASPTLSPDGRSVAFVRSLCAKEDGECLHSDGIWTAATTDGAAATRLVRQGVCPAWSPRGALVFYAWDTGYVVPAAGGTPQRLPAGANCGSWSPNARLLATIGADGRLMVIDVRTRRLRSLPAAGVVESSVWSPDSSTLLVTAHDPESECAALSAVDVRTGKATALRRC
jgi:Tol biopolymer transport system component